MPPTPGPNDLTRQQLDELDALLQRMLGLPLDPPPEPAPAARPPEVRAEPLPLPDLPPGWRLDGGHLHKPDPHAGVPLSPALVPMVATGAVAEAGPDFRRPPVVEADEDDLFTRFGPPTEGTGLPTGPFAYAPAAATPDTPGTLRGVDAPALPSDFKLATVPEPDPEPAAELEPLPTAAAGGLDYRRSPVQTRIVTAAHLEPPAAAIAEPAPLSPVLWPLAAVNWVLETLLGLAGPAGAVAVRPAGKQVLGVLGVLLLAAAAAWTARGLGLVDFPVPARPAWTAGGR